MPAVHIDDAESGARRAHFGGYPGDARPESRDFAGGLRQPDWAGAGGPTAKKDPPDPCWQEWNAGAGSKPVPAALSPALRYSSLCYSA